MTDRRLIALGDSHGNWTMVRDALRLAVAMGAGRVVSVGDFGLWPGRDGERLIDGVANVVDETGVDVVIVPGNHDDYDQLQGAPADAEGMLVLRPGVRAVQRGHTWEQRGRRVFLGLGGAPSIDGPSGVWEQVRGPLIVPAGEANAGEVIADLGGWWLAERLTGADVDRAVAAVDELAAVGRRVEVMVTHEAPMWIDLRHSGPPWQLGVEQRRLLTEAVDRARPDVLLCGHHHRHVIAQSPWGGLGVVLSADVNRAEHQWCVIEWPSDPFKPVQVLRLADWTSNDALPYRAGRAPRTGPLEQVCGHDHRRRRGL